MKLLYVFIYHGWKPLPLQPKQLNSNPPSPNRTKWWNVGCWFIRGCHLFTKSFIHSNLFQLNRDKVICAIRCVTQYLATRNVASCLCQCCDIGIWQEIFFLNMPIKFLRPLKNIESRGSHFCFFFRLQKNTTLPDYLRAEIRS